MTSGLVHDYQGSADVACDVSKGDTLVTPQREGERDVTPQREGERDVTPQREGERDVTSVPAT